MVRFDRGNSIYVNWIIKRIIKKVTIKLTRDGVEKYKQIRKIPFDYKKFKQILVEENAYESKIWQLKKICDVIYGVITIICLVYLFV